MFASIAGRTLFPRNWSSHENEANRNIPVDLRGADLKRRDLGGAVLDGADLREADLAAPTRQPAAADAIPLL